MSITDNDSFPGRLPAPDARVYVLRVWHEGSREPFVWRAAVLEGGDRERKYFASLDDCIEHLYRELGRR